MPVQAVSINTNNSKKIGMCPHGFPQGSCPLCNGMGGGTRSDTKDIRRRPGEMTWNECNAIWQMMKLAEANKEAKELQTIQANLQAQAEKLSKIIEKFDNFIQNTPLQLINKSLMTLDNKILKHLINNVQNLLTTSLTIANSIIANSKVILNNLKQQIIDISDKLVAILGETKNAIQKNISKNLKNFKKKIFNFLGLFDEEIFENEEEKIKEAEQLFKLKTIINKKYTKDLSSQGQLEDARNL